jgi:hypothetical protein
MDTSSAHGHDGQVEPTYPTGREPDPRAVPAVYHQAEDERESTGFTLEVDGELFVLRPDEYGGTDYTWLSGPNPGYGFGESPTPDRSVDEHRESIRAFLADIDPDTGYLTED